MPDKDHRINNQVKEEKRNLIHHNDNECPQKDENGNCKVPGVYSDSDPIGGG